MRGVNIAPVLANPIPDQQAKINTVFGFSVAADPNAGDALSYTATLEDGGALAAWLRFDPQTLSLSARPPRQTSARAPST